MKEPEFAKADAYFHETTAKQLRKIAKKEDNKKTKTKAYIAGSQILSTEWIQKQEKKPTAKIQIKLSEQKEKKFAAVGQQFSKINFDYFADARFSIIKKSTSRTYIKYTDLSYFQISFSASTRYITITFTLITAD